MNRQNGVVQMVVVDNIAARGEVDGLNHSFGFHEWPVQFDSAWT